MTLIKKQIIELYNGLHTLNNLKGVKFAYAITKNINKLKPEIEVLQKVIKPSNEFLKADKERVDIVKEYAKKNEKGGYVINPQTGEYELEDKSDRDELEVRVKAHKEQNQSLYDEREKQFEEYTKLLDEEVDIELHEIKLEDVPQDITTAQMQVIADLVEEPKKDK